MTGTSTSSPGQRDQNLVTLDLLRELDRQQDVVEMCRLVDTSLANVIASERCAIGLIDQADGRIRRVYQRGASPDPANEQGEGPTSERPSLTKVVIETLQPVLHTLSPDHDRFFGDDRRRRSGMQQVLMAPITADSKSIGVLKIFSRNPQRFDASTVRTVETYSRLLGLAIASRNSVPARWRAYVDGLLAETTARIARAQGITDAIDVALRGIHNATGASTRWFARHPDGTFGLEGASDPAHADNARAAEGTLEESLGPRLRDLAPDRESASALSGPILFTDVRAGESAPNVQVRPLGELGHATDAQALVVAPVISGHELLGVLEGEWREDTKHDELMTRAALVQRFGDSLAPTVHRLAGHAHLEKRLSESEAIRRLIDGVARTQDFDDALALICRTSELISGFDRVGIGEITAEGVLWRTPSSELGASMLSQRISVSPARLKRALRGRQAILVEDLRADAHHLPDILPPHLRENLRSAALVPSYVNAKLRGIVLFGSHRLRSFGAEEVARLHSLAATAATAFASADARLRTDDSEQA